MLYLVCASLHSLRNDWNVRISSLEFLFQKMLFPENRPHHPGMVDRFHEQIRRTLPHGLLRNVNKS